MSDTSTQTQSLFWCCL